MEEQKYMTLNDFLRELKKVTSTLTSGEIPLRINGKKVISVEHDVVTDDECHVIECNLKVGLQSNLDRLKEIAEPAPTDWREAAEERRKNREQYHKDLHEWLEKKMSEEISNEINNEVVTGCWYGCHDDNTVEYRIRKMRENLWREQYEMYPGLDKMEYIESVDDAVRMGLTGKDIENAERYFNISELYNRVNDIYMALPKASGDEYRNMVKAYEDLEEELRKDNNNI